MDQAGGEVEAVGMLKASQRMDLGFSISAISSGESSSSFGSAAAAAAAAGLSSDDVEMLGKV